jgi:hypothetical protein
MSSCIGLSVCIIGICYVVNKVNLPSKFNGKKMGGGGPCRFLGQTGDDFFRGGGPPPPPWPLNMTLLPFVYDFHRELFMCIFHHLPATVGFSSAKLLSSKGVGDRRLDMAASSIESCCCRLTTTAKTKVLADSFLVIVVVVL